jgi:hypothetical protein
MSQPKRHHWWPQVQSRFWTGTEGLVNVARKDGTWFQVNPSNIGVESELYTRFLEDEAKDTSIEDWFSTEIDGPARAMIEYFYDESNKRRRRFRGDSGKAKTAQELGFRTKDYIDYFILQEDIRLAIARYVSALLVRHPNYLSKLVTFHGGDTESAVSARNTALDNMLHLYRVYEPVVRNSVFIIIRRDSTSEFLYSDGGLVVEEPWRKTHGIPFDIHAPLTPDFAIQVLPVPFPDDRSIVHVADMSNQGVARMNRIVLGSAKRFVFTRQPPPIQFITKYFGVPAPKNIGYRIINGHFETKYEPSHT